MKKMNLVQFARLIDISTQIWLYLWVWHVITECTRPFQYPGLFSRKVRILYESVVRDRRWSLSILQNDTSERRFYKIRLWGCSRGKGSSNSETRSSHVCWSIDLVVVISVRVEWTRDLRILMGIFRYTMIFWNKLKKLVRSVKVVELLIQSL
jgi:hypothetical protein